MVFLLEEYSMKVLLDCLLPRLFPDLEYILLSHEGKQDLERSIPRKLRAWREPGARFVVLRDNDGANCRELKEKLAALCRDAGREDTLVRIACQELEAWYLGEPEALAEAFGNDQLRRLKGKAKYRDPDSLMNPAEEVAKLVPAFQKVSGARKMGRRLSLARNESQSFRALVNGVKKHAANMLN